MNKMHLKSRITAFMMALLLCIADLPMASITAYASTSGNDAGAVVSNDGSSKWTEHAATGFAGGNGTPEDPYQITSAAELALLAKDNGTYMTNSFKLMNDIDLSAHEWVTNSSKIAGIFDGNGKSITGLRIGTADAPATDLSGHIGLFASVSGTVKDLTVNAAIYVSDAREWTGCGIVAGDLSGTLDHCLAEGSINVTRKHAQVGGIVGTVNSGGTILNCGNTASVNGCGAADAKNYTRIGGIAGSVVISSSGVKENILVANCYNVGTVTATGGWNPFAGGVLGYIQNNGGDQNAQIYVYNCYNAGDVDITNHDDGSGFIGHIASYLAGGTVNRGYLYGKAGTLSKDDHIGTVTSLTGQTDKDLTAMQAADFAETLNTNVSALETNESVNEVVTGLMNWEATTDGTPVIAAGTEDEEPAPEAKSYWTEYAATGFAGGTGTPEDPYQITTAAELALLVKDNGTYMTNSFKLMNDIDLSAYEWLPNAAKIAGIFDGNGYSITGLKIGTAEEPAKNLNGHVGLFAGVSGTVKNLTVNAAIYVSDAREWTGCGIVAGTLSGTLDHCLAEGIIDVTRKHAQVGGIVGEVNSGGTILNCGNTASVSGGGTALTRIGGIAGSVVISSSEIAPKNLLVANCYNVGTVTATGGNAPLAGGVLGDINNNGSSPNAQVYVYNCYNAGDVDIINNVGKIGNITPHTIGKVNTGYLYGKADALSTGGHTVLTCTGQEDMALTAMQAEKFAENLEINADALVGQGGIFAHLLGWKAVANDTPTFSDTPVEGKMTTLSVTVNSSRLGSVTIDADYVDDAKTILVKGSKVKLTIIPVSGCEMKTLTLNGENKTVSENTFEFTLEAATKIEVVFEVVNTVDVDPIYVDPSANAGGDGTENSPFQNLEQAKEKVRTVLAQQSNANITVYLMGGTYLLEETFELGEEDTSLGRVTYKNYEDECPVITSGHSIDGSFTKVEGKEYYSYQLPDTAKVGTGSASTWPQFRDLYVNGERAEIARTEELIFKHTYANSVYGSSTSATTITECDNLLYVSADALVGIDNTNLAGVEIGQLVEWNSFIFHIGSLTGNTKSDGEVEITIDQEEWDHFYATNPNKKSLIGRGYWLQNHINFLDAPGEFYYDQSNGIIYYYPLKGQDMGSATVEYATLDTLVKMENAANITFDGITFTGTTANYINENGLTTMLGCTLRFDANDQGQHMPFSAIQGNYAEGIQIKNCIFEELGGSAIVFHCGIKDLQISGNVIKDIAMAGIQVGRNQLRWKEGASEDVTIDNNYITNIGTITFGAPAIKVARSKNLNIQYNKIVHVPYSAIMTGIGWNVSPTDEDSNTNLINADISYNYIEDFLYKINDGGAIYTCGANDFVTETEYMNEIHHNYIRAGAHNGTYTGIYHDGSASNWHTYSNLIDDLKSNKGPIFFQDDVPSQYTHNILAENNYSTVSQISQYGGEKDSDGNPRNIVLKNNTMFDDRSELSAEAIAIMNGAGLQDAYKHLEAPMDVELRIADNTMRYEVNKKQESNTIMQIELTNNSAVDQEFTLSITGALPKGIALIVNDGNVVNVKSKETVIVNAEFSITDADKVLDTEDYIVGLEVTDKAGRVVPYPRIFTVKTLSGNDTSEIPYGTPVVDGILDKAYLDGARNFFGPVFYPSVYEETEIDGGYYLLWDENYLYCYVIVNEPTITSKGTEWIEEQVETGQHGKLWKTDAVETYIKVPSIGPVDKDQDKFAVDAFGIQRFGNDVTSLEHHDYLPYATKFTYDDEIIDKEIPATIAAGQTASEAMGTDVTGYVIEMTLPITLMESIIESDDGIPSAGDIVEFYIQNNDYRGVKPDGTEYVVAQANVMSEYILKAKEETNVLENFSINSIGSANSGVEITAPADGWTEGTNTFTVTSEKASVVLVSYDCGVTYERLAATKADDDTENCYSFTAENVTADTQITVAVAGDVNGDGKISNADITKLRLAYAQKTELDAVQAILADVNGSDSLTNADITKLRLAYAGKSELNW